MMKKTLLFLALILAVVSCTQQPKCNDPEVQAIVIKTLKNEISKNVEAMLRADESITSDMNYKSFQPLFKNREKYLEEIESKLYEIRTTDLKKEIKKCDCEAEISIVDKSDVDLSVIQNDYVGGDFNIVDFSPTIEYTAQITDEKKIYITISNPEDFEVITRNVFAKVLKDILEKNEEIASKNQKSATSQNLSVNNGLDEELLNDLSNLPVSSIAEKWVNSYDLLPSDYKNNVFTENDSYQMTYGDLYGLNKGFSWGLCSGYDANGDLAEYIAEAYGATGGKSSNEVVRGYRAGMVYFYVKSKILNCGG